MTSRERARTRLALELRADERPVEPDCDRFVRGAADAFAAPIALLTLIDGDRLWVKAATGVGLQCAPRDQSFCTHAVDRAEPLEVCDARADPRFAQLAVVTGPLSIRYYLGAPLALVSGTEVGALCVLDRVPRPPATRDQRAYLVALARQASALLEHRAHTRSRLSA